MIFIESIKLKEGKIFHLSYHQERVEETFSIAFPYAKVLNLQKELQKITLPRFGLYKIRVEYNDKDCQIEILPYQPREIKNFQVVHCNTINYPLKSVDRDIFSRLKENIIADEIIIVRNGLVTDTSFSNLVFYSDSQWITPESFLLNGTCRKRLLVENKIQQRPITIADISQFEKIGIINAMIDLGEVQLEKPFMLF